MYTGDDDVDDDDDENQPSFPSCISNAICYVALALAGPYEYSSPGDTLFTQSVREGPYVILRLLDQSPAPLQTSP